MSGGRMGRSVLEQEFARKTANLAARMRAHDRGVLLGVAFSLLPVFPLAFLGLAIGMFNRAMHRAGRLSDYDDALARRGVMLALVNCVLSVVLLVFLVRIAAGLEWHQLIGDVMSSVNHLVDAVLGRVRPAIGRGATSV